MKLSSRLLVVEDDEELRVTITQDLEDHGHRVAACGDAGVALRELERCDFDAVITDVMMPGMNGIELCSRLSGDRPGVPVIVMTAYGDVPSAVAALRAGAYDFIAKPFKVDALGDIVANALGRVSFDPPLTRLSEPPPRPGGSHCLVGSSSAMRLIVNQIARIAPTESTVLITGETGTGKELVARAIHEASRRRAGPFVAVSCAAVPAEILEAELFGYSKGAFTGASVPRAGLLRDANGGTLFLDEIGDMPPSMQPKILRALQERRFRPLGAQRERSFDARVVAATNKDLEESVITGEFRQDLYFRIKVLELRLPPLRERGSDVIELALHFLARESKGAITYALEPDAERRLRAHEWPGNVRELENCMSAGVALSTAGRISSDDLGITPNSSCADGVELQAIARRHVARVVRAVGGNKTIAAKALGINRASLYRKLRGVR